MSQRPKTTFEYFKTFGLQEFRGDSWVMGYVSQLAFACQQNDEFLIQNILMDAQDYVSAQLDLKFSGYYFGNPPDEKFKI